MCQRVAVAEACRQRLRGVLGKLVSPKVKVSQMRGPGTSQNASEDRGDATQPSRLCQVYVRSETETSQLGADTASGPDMAAHMRRKIGECNNRRSVPKRSRQVSHSSAFNHGVADAQVCETL
eukprot:1320921-Rhodomonas_salina.5